MTAPVTSLVRDQAMRWLVRREYGRLELSRRLRSKGYEQAAIDGVVQSLTDEGSQSDQRFTDEYIHARANRGFGPNRIGAELGERGIERDLITSQLDRDGAAWDDRALVALRKRFAPAEPVGDYSRDARERQRRERFLHQRGFTPTQIRWAMSQPAGGTWPVQVRHSPPSQ